MRYTLTVFVGGRVLDWEYPMADPFHRTTVTLGWRDLLRGLIRRSLDVEVKVSADREMIEQVLLLDPDWLGRSDSPRRKAFNAQLMRAVTGESDEGDPEAVGS